MNKARSGIEKIIKLHIEKLLEGDYLATTDNLQGLVVQGKTISETLEIARDVAQKPIESQTNTTLSPVAESFDCPLVVGQ